MSCSSSSCTDYGNKAAASASATASASASASTTFLHDIINNSLSSPSPSHPNFLQQHNSSFPDTAFAAMHHHQHHHNVPIIPTTAPASGGRSDGLTRDFLGLRPLSHGDILSLTGFGNCIVPNSSNLHPQIQKPWQG